MPGVKIKDFRGLSAEELKHKRQALEKELFELQQKKITGQSDKPHQFKLLRRQIAQVNTIVEENSREKKDG